MPNMEKRIHHINKIAALILLLLCFGLSAVSQSEENDLLVSKFNQYQQYHLQEKMFIHTDKEFYLAGEQIHLKLYITDGILNNLCGLSKLAYVELLDFRNNPVLQAKIATDSGTGNATLDIPASFKTGNYILRGYTQWMKNNPAGFYYSQEISIVNTIRETGYSISPELHKKQDIQFFPEGGYLINGFKSVVAFKLINENEKGVNCKGFILNQNNDTICSFSPLKFGMGQFELTATKGQHYRALIQTADTTFFKDLPAAKDLGSTLSVKELIPQQIDIKVQSTARSGSDIYLLVHAGQVIRYSQKTVLNNGLAVFTISKKELSDGINHITIFNEKGIPECDRLFFKSPEKCLALKIKPSKSTFHSREKVDVELNARDENNIPLSSDLSVSVFLKDSLQKAFSVPNIQSYLLLTSDLKGYIESPEYYFAEDPADAGERSKAIDNLLLTQGWNRFSWDDVLNTPKKEIHFYPEMEGPLIRGKITDKKSGYPADKIMAYLTVPGLHFKFCTSVSDANGEIVFNPGRFDESNEIIVQPNNEIDSMYRIQIMDPYSDQFTNIVPTRLKLTSGQKKDLINRSIATQTLYIFHPQNAALQFASTDTLPFYGNPDFTYYLDAYTRFTSMEEVMREYISEVHVKEKKNGFHYSLWNSRYNMYNDEEPLVLIDGLPVFNTSKIIAFDPLKIKKIDIVTQTNLSGSLISSGIINYSTYNGDLAGFALDPTALLLEYDGVQKQKQVYQPQYTNQEQLQSRIPDMRNVLYWSPNLKTGKSGNTSFQFYTSDLKGNYLIVIQGISTNGVPGFKTIEMITD